jgi:transcriptional regulator
MPRRHLRVAKVSQIIILLREGYSQREVAQILNTNKSVVSTIGSTEFRADFKFD